MLVITITFQHSYQLQNRARREMGVAPGHLTHCMLLMASKRHFGDMLKKGAPAGSLALSSVHWLSADNHL